MSSKTTILIGAACAVGGFLTSMAVRSAVKYYRNSKETPENAWERAWNAAEFIAYNPNWGSCVNGTTSEMFNRLYTETDLAEMHTYSCVLPNGIRALIVVPRFGSAVAIYESALYSKTYFAGGNVEVMNKRIDNVSVFVGAIPEKYLVDVCDPSSAVYFREEYDRYYLYSSWMIRKAAEGDKAAIGMVTDLIAASDQPDFSALTFLEKYLPEITNKYYPQLTISANDTTQTPKVDLLPPEDLPTDDPDKDGKTI